MIPDSLPNCALSTKEVIAFVEAKGLKVTERQLQRWQSQGLIPHPKQWHQKGVPGSRTIYPFGAENQILTLCQIKQIVRATKRCGWHLWCLGWQVDDRYWKPIFDGNISSLENFFRLVLESNGPPSEKQSKEIQYDYSDQVRDAVEAIAIQIIHHPWAGPVKQRLGAKVFETLVNMALDVVIGLYHGQREVLIVDKTDQTPTVMGVIQRAFSNDLNLAKHVSTVFEFISDRSKSGTLVAEFKKFSPRDWQIAAMQISPVIGQIAELSGRPNEVPKVNGIPGYSLELTTQNHAALILAWCVVHQMPIMDESIRKYFADRGIPFPH